ncbi:MAG TPA: L-threonylcarbamoyladenylate synthase [Thermoanaerobaculia bacterium]|nr:L-threonylcarbamoyladenylate synthase [Thermoanaerobaculia bacterium]
MTTRWPASDRESGPGDDALKAIAMLIRDDEVVILPTDTVYGLHGKALSETAAARIGELKGRADDKPYVVLCATPRDLDLMGVTATSDITSYLIEAWPASLTAVLPIEVPIPASRGKLSLAIRIPRLPWLRHLMESTGPLISTSVNRSGGPEASEVADIEPEIAGRVSGIVDSGPISGRASTIVDFTSDPPSLLREGDFAFAQNLWKKARKSL